MLYLCICVFAFVYLQVRHPGTLFFRSSYNYLLKNIAPFMSICNSGQCCICVFARHPATLFLRPSYHYLFKNIAHVMSICNFDQCSICVFVYLYLCICKSDTREHCFCGPLTITFSKNIAHVMCIRNFDQCCICLLYTSPSPRDYAASRMPSSA